MLTQARQSLITAALITISLASAGEASSGVTVYPMNLAGFNNAVEAHVVVDFDSISPGTDISGTTMNGLTFLGPGAPLLVVRGSDTYTPSGFTGVIDAGTNILLPTSGDNVLSPGGVMLGPGLNNSLENDDLTVLFSSPVQAFGFDHLSQSADGCSFTWVYVYAPSDILLYSGPMPITGGGCDAGNGGAPGAPDFWGIVSSGVNIKKVVVDEYDSDAAYPDANIGFDTFRTASFIPCDHLPGDANCDGTVDLLDLDIFGSNYGACGVGWGEGDFNDDGCVNLLDLDILGQHYGETTGAVPEPATLGLLAIGGLAMMRRRRKWLMTAVGQEGRRRSE